MRPSSVAKEGKFFFIDRFLDSMNPLVSQAEETFANRRGPSVIESSCSSSGASGAAKRPATEACKLAGHAQTRRRRLDASSAFRRLSAPNRPSRAIYSRRGTNTSQLGNTQDTTHHGAHKHTLHESYAGSTQPHQRDRQGSLAR